MRVLLDANVIISYLLNVETGGPIGNIFDALFADKFTLLLPDLLLDEVTITIERKPKLRDRIPGELFRIIVSELKDVAEEVPKIKGEIPRVTRDPADDYLLAYAFVGEADYLVTGDKDLLVLGTIDQLKIITPAKFSEAIT